MTKNVVTYSVALDYVLTNYPVPENIAERLTALKASVEKRNATHGSDESRAKSAEKRKAETAAKRAAFVAQYAPIVRAAMDSTPRTAKEIFERMKSNLPADFGAAKVQYMLVHKELGEDVKTIDGGRNANTYSL